MLNLESCRERQRRLLGHMEAARLDLVALGNAKTIYYFTGSLVDASLPQAFALAAAGDSLLVTSRDPERSAASRVVSYTAYTLERVFNRASMNAEAAGLLREFAGRPRAVAVDFEFLNAGLTFALGGGEPANITPALDEMRRVKDPDELECMRDTIRITEAAYAAIRAKLEPGMTEYQAYNVIHEAMVNAAGTSVDLRGDFACGTRAIGGGGPPTGRTVGPNDLYIFDLFPFWQGYMCDLCRTFAAGEPTPLQQEAWAHIDEAHRLARRLIRPGARGSDVYREVRAHLERFAPTRGSFTHHLGHGVGMDGWEFPWLTPGSGQVIQEGEVIACEPGLYADALHGGIRLEHNYLVGRDTVTPLDSFPLELR